jgi:hypothetical protein
MKNIIKTRNFDSIKKLSYKRANGKRKNIVKLNDDAYKTIKTLDKLNLLKPELLWDLIEIRKILYIEQEKLNYVLECRKNSLSLSNENMLTHINRLANIKLAVLRIPYEIRNKYYSFITKKEQNKI